MLKKYFTNFCALVCGVLTLNSFADTFTLPANGDDVVGEVQNLRLSQVDNLNDITARYDIGYYELLEANPKLNPYHLVNGTPITIPKRYVLPNAPHEGIVINLAELRLYYYPQGENIVITKPIGIGRQGWDTPEGEFKIVEKIEHPAWHVPKSIEEDLAKDGITVDKVVPPGPDNPLGDFAMRLSLPSYLIHGTNYPQGVGRRVSSGCIRMYPKDIAELFSVVPVGTPVKIVNQPYKYGWLENQLMMESHQPLKEMRKQYADNLPSVWVQSLDKFVGQQISPVAVDWQQVNLIAKNQEGIPEAIGQRMDKEANQS